MACLPHWRKAIGLTVTLCATACVGLAVVASPFAAPSKLPACAKGQRSTAAKPCRVAKKPAANRYVPTAVCNPGERSTAAKPCIALADNGPPPPSSQSSSPFPSSVPSSPSPKPSSTPPLPAAAPTLSGPHISTHLCQDVTTGQIFECQPELDPGNPSLANYPPLQ